MVVIGVTVTTCAQQGAGLDADVSAGATIRAAAVLSAAHADPTLTSRCGARAVRVVSALYAVSDPVPTWCHKAELALVAGCVETTAATATGARIRPVGVTAFVA